MFQKPNVFPNKELLYQKYVLEKKTDREIAMEFGVDRTYIVHSRKFHNIPSRKSTGVLGETLSRNALESQGFSVINMNEFAKTFPFDFLVNNYIRIEVKSSVLNQGQYPRFTFCLSEKPENNNVESDCRIKLPNGRTRKIYRKTCDFLIFACLGNTETKFYIVPSDGIPDEKGMISIPETGDSKYSKYKNNWNLLIGR